MRTTTRLAALAVAGLAVLAACGGSPPFTAHGSDQVCVDAPDITTGGQVTVTDSDRHVLGTGTLAEDDSAAARKVIQEYDTLQASLSGLEGSSTSGMSIYKFTVTGLPAGQARYGISVGGQNRGTVWFTEKQMRAGPGLTLGC